jgi:hypothetical protein
VGARRADLYYAGTRLVRLTGGLTKGVQGNNNEHGYLSGTIIRGTPRLLISAGNPHQHKAAKA